MYQIVQKYSNKCRHFCDVNTFQTVFDNKPMITRIKNLSKRRNDDSFMRFCFSTLYTETPHSKLLKVFNELTEFYFNGVSHEFISE